MGEGEGVKSDLVKCVYWMYAGVCAKDEKKL